MAMNLSHSILTRRVISKDIEYFKNIFPGNCYIYFPSFRFEFPHWLNQNAINLKIEKTEEIPVMGGVRGILNKSLVAFSSLEATKKWIFDVVFDYEIYNDFAFFTLINHILETIIGVESVSLGFAERAAKHRIMIGTRNNEGKWRKTLIPAIDNLSSGQIVLFNLFSTILNHSDKGIKTYAKIKDGFAKAYGIVLIDEVDLHLHTELQKNVLPKLIKLFPKIQFIISSHAPLFLMGMENEFGSDGFEIREMPEGKSISAEGFSEFEKSFEHYKATQKFESVIQASIQSLDKPIIITEGKTDALLIKTAWEKLYPNEERRFEVIASGIEPEESDQIGSAEIVRRELEFLARITSKVIIGLFDNDREGNEQFKGLNKRCFENYDRTKDLRKHKTKTVWGLLLPGPDLRVNFITIDNINQRYLVIEHYFSNEILEKYSMRGNGILKTEVFEIIGDKNRFAEKTEDFDTSEFQNFKILFDRIELILVAAGI